MPEVLVIGGGGREQALAWKLAQSAEVSKVYVAPGNAGSAGKVENIDIRYDDVEGLLHFALKKDISLTVIGQEAASAAGVADRFLGAGLNVFGPSKAAVTIETSKAFSKQLMEKEGIPTAGFKTFDDPDKATEYALSRPSPVVIKADGLATGKGVIIAENEKEIRSAITAIMIDRSFGDAGARVVVEDFLKGSEVSMHALCDGRTSVIFPPSQDHKQAFDNDEGPNTGGMGVIAPLDWLDSGISDRVNAEVVAPALKGLKDNGSPFIGCLYPGLMLERDGLNVLEFNARFGDPEAEVYMRLLDSDLYLLLLACVKGKLGPEMVRWKRQYAVSVVLASQGYPGKYETGLPITGIDDAEKVESVIVFHAGTAEANGGLVTNGGRVLNVTALGATLEEALKRAYQAAGIIDFQGKHFRHDIGKRIPQQL